MAHNTKDEIGNRYGRLIVIDRGLNRNRKAYWVCNCDCGSVTVVVGYALRSGQTQSCGCIRKELLRERSITHGMTNTREYKIWKGLRVRCYTKGHHSYPKYGGRGIIVDPRWDDFQNFYDDMGPRPSSQHSIDRIDGNGPYSPGNCRWATPSEQRENTNNISKITYKGETMSIAQWARRLDMHYITLYHRLRDADWSIERALTEEVHSKFTPKVHPRKS